MLRHFDAVDEEVADRLLRVKPFDEPALTSLLCDLMDQEQQRRYRLAFDVDRLRRKIRRVAPLLDVEISIETHEYPSSVENLVTQSDLGIVFEYRDMWVPSRSWTDAYLLQAKRLFRSRGTYALNSGFTSQNPAQHRRMTALDELFGSNFVKYLLYVPRPDRVAADTAAVLRHLRDVNIQDNIFDFALGLELQREAVRGGSTLDPGLLITPARLEPRSYSSAYGNLFNTSLPWSWFMTASLLGGRPGTAVPFLLAEPGRDGAARRVAFARGDTETVTGVVDVLASDRGRGASRDDIRIADRRVPPFLPARSITVLAVVNGQEEDPDEIELR